VFFDTVVGGSLAQGSRSRGISTRAEGVVGAVLVSAALVVGLVTARDYGLTVDEFNTDDYGPKALAWYTSGFTDRSHFETVEQYLWYYGPWLHILIAFVQSFHLAHPHTVRHAMTFLVGLAGVAALIPIARLTVGRWAGPVAVGLCLMTGYLYGSLFFTPIDVPFMAAMTWATLAVLVMAQRTVPSWPATFGAGLLTGLALATRTGGIITHAYLVGVMALCGLDLLVRFGRLALRPLAQIALRTLAAMAIAWVVAIALWPWLQIGNPLKQFAIAYVHFKKLDTWFPFQHWGTTVHTNELPWHYIPGQLLARLPEGFLVLLAIGVVLALATAVLFARAVLSRFRERGVAGLAAPALAVARARGTLMLVAAVVVPPGFLIIKHSTLYDGVRHTLFVIPILAVLAGGAGVWAFARLRRFPIAAGLVMALAFAHVAATVVTLVRLHPLEYVAMNSLAGGTSGAAGRFDLDYWSIAASVGLRRLERRLDNDTSGRFATTPPHVLVCIGNREWIADRLFRRNWRIEPDIDKADFIIDTERWPCAKDSDVRVIDAVTRLGVTFSRTYARPLPD
jgi:hypothetical protein